MSSIAKSLLQENCLCHLEEQSCIEISGPERIDFCQGQFSCDVAGLSSGEATLGAYCNVKGRVQSVFRLLMFDDRIIIKLPKVLIDLQIKELQKYGRFSKVEIKELPIKLIGLSGPDALSQIKLFENPLAVCQIPGIQACFEVFAPHKWPQLTEVDESHWRLHNISNNIADIFLETYEKFLPHNIGLPEVGAVSFEKGCYRGQEIVSRMQHRAKLKKTLHRIALAQETLPKPFEEITDEQGKAIGHVVSSCPAPEGGVVVLLEGAVH